MATSNERTEFTWLLSAEQRQQLSKLLYKAKPRGPHEEAVQRMDRLAADFRTDLENAGFRPFAEAWTGAERSEAYEENLQRLLAKIDSDENNLELAGIAKADKLLRDFVANMGRCWKDATGRPLPKLKLGMMKSLGIVGPGPDFAIRAGRHPLAIAFEAVGLDIAPWIVHQLVLDTHPGRTLESLVPMVQRTWYSNYPPARLRQFPDGDLLLTQKQQSQLAQLLHDAAPERSHGETLRRLDQLAATFRKDLQSLGVRPCMEMLDECLGRESYVDDVAKLIEMPASAEAKEKVFSIEGADDCFHSFVRDVGEYWREGTGGPLPTLSAEFLEKCGVGYRPELAKRATGHPLWLMFEAVGLKVSAWTVNLMVCIVRREAGENIGVPKAYPPNYLSPRNRQPH
jgi:hypothetical protein